MKKNVLFILFIFIISLIPVTAAGSEALRYNYKLDLASSSVFPSYYWSSGGSKNDPPQKSAALTFPQGKYGRAMQITPSAIAITDPSNRYNSYVFNFNTAALQVGDEEIILADYFREVHTISFWVKTPVNTRTATARKIQFSYETNNGKYAYKFNLPNTGEWEYLSLPLGEFKKSGVSFTTDLAGIAITQIKSWSIDFGYSDFYGKDPDASTAAAPWTDELMLDDILFNRSTPENPAITPPSVGEEEYSENCEILKLIFDDEVCEVDLSASVLNIEVSKNITVLDIEQKLKVIPKCPDIAASPSTQVTQGAAYKITPPESIPGTGKIIVTSANTKRQAQYNLYFKVREPFQILYGKMTGINLTQGYNFINLPYCNESDEDTYNFTVVSAVKDIRTNETLDIYIDDFWSVPPNTTDFVYFSLYVRDENCDINIFILDDSKKQIFSSYSALNGKSAKAAGTDAVITSSSVVYDPVTSIVEVKGKVNKYTNGEPLIVLDYDSQGGNLCAVNKAETDKDGNFKVSYFINDFTYGLHTILYSIQGDEQNYIYVNIKYVEDCIRDFADINASSSDLELEEFWDYYMDVLLLPEDLYNGLNSENKLNALRNAAKASTYAEIKESILSQMVFYTLNQYQSIDVIKSLFENYNNILKLDLTKPFYTKHITSQSQIDLILERLAKETYSGFSELQNKFLDFALLMAFDSVLAYGEVAALLSDNKTQIGNRVDYTMLGNLPQSKAESFYKAVAKASITDFDDIKDLLLAAYNSSSTGSQSGSIPDKSSSSGGSATTKITTGSVKIDEFIPVSEEYFDDLNNVEWAREAINILYEKGVVSGRGDKVFDPEANITREEYVKLLVTAFKLNGNGSVSFSDVDEGAWYFDYINTAASLSVVEGNSDDTFGVLVNITREDIAVMTFRVLKYLEKAADTEVNSGFLDKNTISDYALNAVDTLYSMNIINGSDNSFNPKAYATRAEAAKIIYAALQALAV